MGEKPMVEGSLAKKQPRVIVIEADKELRPKKLRVAAYARVSSDSTDQLNSFMAQVRYYTTYITSREEWTFVDLYADEGITGTSAEKRTEFQRLIADCKRGLIDKVLCKYCKDSPTMEEGPLQQAILRALNSVMGPKEVLIERIGNAIRQEMAPKTDDFQTLTEIDRSLEELQSRFQALLEEVQECGGDFLLYQEEFMAINEQMTTLQTRRAQLLKAQQADLAITGRLQEAESLLAGAPSEITEWDEALVRQTVETVKVLSAHEILVCLKGGTEIRETVL